MNLKSIFKKEELHFGFYVSLAVVALMLITAICYTASFAGTRDFSAGACVVMFVGTVAAAIMLFFKQTRKYAPYVAAILAFTSLLLYVNGVYLYVSEVFVGIDETEFSVGFIVSTAFYCLTFVTALVNIFFPVIRTAKPEVETQESEVATNE